MSTVLEREIEADCGILLIRSLLGKSVVAFGEDGLGNHGRNDLAVFYSVEDIALDVVMDDDGEPYGTILLKLSGYDASQFGHICSDTNFMISVRSLLKDQHIDPDCLKYSDIDLQGDDFVSLDIDVVKLLDWA